MRDDLSAREEALSHPLRQALFTLVRHRTATAAELQGAVDEPLSVLTYHLQVLVERGCLLTDENAGATRYRVDPRAAHMIADQVCLKKMPERIVMMSVLDAGWAALGRSPESVVLIPRWEIFSLDDEGLFEAAAVVTGSLDRIQRIAARSKKRQAADTGEYPKHVVVAVASLPKHPPDNSGGVGP